MVDRFKLDGKEDVLIVVGSRSDLLTVKVSKMCQILKDLGINYKVSVISTHRNNKVLIAFVEKAKALRVRRYIAIAGMSAGLPGSIAGIDRMAQVFGVGLDSGFMDGLDAAFSIFRMPGGVPVSFMGIGKSALANAAISVAQSVALGNKNVETALERYFENTNPEAEFNISIDEIEEKK